MCDVIHLFNVTLLIQVVVAHFLFVKVQTLLGMANLPRWIESWKCDSQAMYSAFSKYCWSCSNAAEQNDLAALYAFIHYHPDASETNLPIVVNIQCQGTGCRRCASGAGGYVFRWYDKRWYTDYILLKRDGAWTLDSELSVG